VRQRSEVAADISKIGPIQGAVPPWRLSQVEKEERVQQNKSKNVKHLKNSSQFDGENSLTNSEILMQWECNKQCYKICYYIEIFE
jgi:hypothetical protein